MASPSILNLEKLTAPISEDSATGIDIRLDPSPTSPYQLIKSERSAARAAERKSLHDGDTSEADEHWRKVLEIAPTILESQSKDLEIVSWFTEALIRRCGFSGLRDGFSLIHTLIESYWDGLYPMPDEDGLETRVASLSGLNGEGAEGVLIAPIRKVPITEGGEPGPFSYWQYQQALDCQRAPDENTRAAKISSLGFSIEDIERSVDTSNDQYFIDLRDDVTECIGTYKKISELLDQYCGAMEAPPTRTIIEVLDECLGAINHIARHKLSSNEQTESAGNEPDQPSGTNDIIGESNPVKPVGGPVASREAAFKQLLEIASFFRKTEPHSPLSYMIEKTVKWGNMSLSELMVELIPDSSSRDHFSELTGVKTED